MASPPLRKIIFKCLERWENETIHADRILADLSKKYQLESRDHAFVQQIFYGIIRNLTLLDTCIDHLRNHKSLKHRLRLVLRIGLYQIRLTNIATHAAVNETVTLADNRAAKSLVNAILRNAMRKEAELDELVASLSLEEAFSHPAFLIERWEKSFGEDNVSKLCAWNNEAAPVYLRLNSLSANPEALTEIRDSEFTHIAPNAPDDFLRLDGPIPPDWIGQGLIYIQDPSTSIACQLLEPKPGQIILDACGAPGGKTIWLAGAMKNSGQIISCDNDEKRLLRLEENLKRSHVSNCELRQIDWLTPDNDSAGFPNPASFDSILIDAPCSNTGVMRRRIDVRWRLQPKDFRSMQTQQLEITRNCLPLLKPGGHLVYSTCSLEAEENQQAIDILLTEFPALELEESKVCLPWENGFDGAFAARLRLKAS
ncbi:MAG: 16S rRNA (cytosine(967)-C(5))-methyltransferase RsmB [Verrucomicrobia bacterium]|nr:16S rRNA (cytosine(967)-C(5))-methyltransferase RsmB [Verrucomicrobiota bacterium]